MSRPAKPLANEVETPPAVILRTPLLVATSSLSSASCTMFRADGVLVAKEGAPVKSPPAVMSRIRSCPNEEHSSLPAFAPVRTTSRPVGRLMLMAKGVAELTAPPGVTVSTRSMKNDGM